MDKRGDLRRRGNAHAHHTSNTECHQKSLCRNVGRCVRNHASKGHLYVMSDSRDISYRTLQSFHTDDSAIRASLGMRIDACKSSTLKLSHVSKFEPKFALGADLLVFEDRHLGLRTFSPGLLRYGDSKPLQRPNPASVTGREREIERALLGTMFITGWSRARPGDRRCMALCGLD